jgi:hypothetical protein
MVTKNWDIFISHASEDKESFVKPLAETLKSLGVRVWYDDFTLSIGDSLSRSIDKGLINSNYGIVVLSPSFFQKDWPEYELKGLFAKEIGNKKVILPIWHQIDREQLLNYSVILADKIALSSSKLSIDQIAIKLIEIARPDIFRGINKKLIFYNIFKKGKRSLVSIEKLKSSPIRHENLHPFYVNNIRLIRASLLDVYPKSMEFWLDCFKRELYPGSEIASWQRIAAVYLEYSNFQELSTEQKHTAFSVIVLLSMGLKYEEIKTNSDKFKTNPDELPSNGVNIINHLIHNDTPSLDYEENLKS